MRTLSWRALEWLVLSDWPLVALVIIAVAIGAQARFGL